MKPHLPVRKAILLRRTYEAPAEGRADKIRLDFNENTTGCSAAVRRALARLSAKQIATYPEYEASTRKLARYFRVSPEELLLTNGGDDALRVFFRHLRRAAHGRAHLRAHFSHVSLLRRNRRSARESSALRSENGISIGRRAGRLAEEAAFVLPRESQQSHGHSCTRRRYSKAPSCCNPYRRRARRSLRRIFPLLCCILDSPLSESVCCAYFFEGGRNGRSAFRRGDRPTRFPRFCAPRHASLSCESRCTGGGRSCCGRTQNRSALRS